MQRLPYRPITYEGVCDPSQRPTIRLGNRRHHYLSLIPIHNPSSGVSDASGGGSGDETIAERSKRKVLCEPVRRYKKRGEGLSGSRLSTTIGPEVINTLSTWNELPKARMSVRPSTISGNGLFAEVSRTREVCFETLEFDMEMRDSNSPTNRPPS